MRRKKIVNSRCKPENSRAEGRPNLPIADIGFSHVIPVRMIFSSHTAGSVSCLRIARFNFHRVDWLTAECDGNRRPQSGPKWEGTTRSKERTTIPVPLLHVFNNYNMKHIQKTIIHSGDQYNIFWRHSTIKVTTHYREWIFTASIVSVDLPVPMVRRTCGHCSTEERW